jgi:hypothetical protein
MNREEEYMAGALSELIRVCKLDKENIRNEALGLSQCKFLSTVS